MSLKRKSKMATLLEDENVCRWYDNNARGSQITADVYARRLAAICLQLEKTPQDLIGMDQKKLYYLLLDFVSSEEKRGVSGSYIHTSVKVIKSWLSYNGIVVPQKIKIRGQESTPTLKDERVPTQEELRKILRSASPRDRVSVAIMAYSGVRPEVLGNYDGNDGLTFGDFPEMRIENGEIVFDKIPTMVVIRPELSKSKRKYLTFLGGEGCEYLKEYLEGRLRKGDIVGEGTDIIAPKVMKKSFIRSTKVSEGIRKAIRAAGFKWRPYVLRAYCDTQLLLAESKGEMTHSYRQFFMGHVGDMESRYTTNKGRLSEEMMEDMRNSYKRSLKYLQTVEFDMKTETTEVTLRKHMMRVVGLSEEEIDEEDLAEMNVEELYEVMRRKLVGVITGNGGSQKVVSMKELTEYIEKGWEYVTTLPTGEAIVKFPTLSNGGK